MCEVYCVAACCQLEAYKLDVDYLACASRVVPDEIAAAAQRLDDMIATVGMVDEAVESLDFHFCYTWPTGAACAAYLGQWRQALSSARSKPVGETDPHRRLARAGERNSDPWQREVIELFRGARILLEFGYRERFAELLRIVIALDDGEQSPLRQYVESARDSMAPWG